MLDEFKDFWSRYKPYDLHPDDKAYINNSNITSKIQKNPDKYLLHLEISFLNKTFSNNLKDEKNNKIFQEDYNPYAIHTNMFCKSFLGDIENAKIILLYGNPGLELGDYHDEHENQDYITGLNEDYIFKSKGFLPMRDISKNTGGYIYWKEGNRFKGIINSFAIKKNITIEESYNFIVKNICILQSIGYHSPKTPTFKPSDLPSSLMTKRLLHEYILPKARNNKLIIFSWRQSNFWGLEQQSNVIKRKTNAAISPYFTDYEASSIVDFLI
jgi:hypothetical protein